jgi:hypothetical protein
MVHSDNFLGIARQDLPLAPRNSGHRIHHIRGTSSFGTGEPSAAERRTTMRKHRVGGLLAGVACMTVLVVCWAATVTADQPNPVTAIDILLEPDATMVKKAEAANQRLLKEFPKGFALGKSHQPHISCLQRYVKTEDLDKVFTAVGKVLAEEKPTTWKLKAYKFDFAVWDKLGVTVMLIEPTDDLIRYQKKLIDAVSPFTVKAGTAAAFVTTKEAPDINQPTIDYVASYVPDASGKKFMPHVTVGVTLPKDAEKLRDEKFEAFTFSPAGASVYHLGNFGTARTKLKSWELKP